MANLFYLAVILTVLTTRIFLFIAPIPSPTVGGLRLHHYMYGLAGFGLAVVLQSPTLGAVSCGLFVDQVPFLLLAGKTHQDNYSARSLIGLVLLLAFVFLIRNDLVALVSQA